MSYNLQAQISNTCAKAITERTFPGCVVGYIQHGKTTVLPHGRLTYEETSPEVTADTVYDLASVTKSIPTAALILKLIETGKLSLDDKIVNFVPEIQNEWRQNILIRHLLSYTTAFKLPQGLAGPARKGLKHLNEALFKAQMVEPPGTAYSYSNTPAIWLGMAAERIYGKHLDKIAQEVFFAPLGMNNTTFDGRRFPSERVAPTEIDWRGEIRGEVHDESAWVLRQSGLVVGNAGLFSTAADLLKFARMLLNGGELYGIRYFQPETIQLMHTNQIADLGDSAGLGWEVGQERFMGSNASRKAFGKTGFTGTFIMIDQEREAAMVLLSNRTYPRRPGTRDGINTVRRKLADLIFSR